MGKGNNGTYDMAVLMRDGATDTGNVFLGYTTRTIDSNFLEHMVPPKMQTLPWIVQTP